MKKLKKILFFALTLTLFISCGGDDELLFDPCADLVSPTEVTILNPSIQAVDNDTLTGYVIKGTVVNNTSNIIEGRAIIHSNANGITFSYSSSLQCNELQPNSSCTFLDDVFISREEIDFNVNVRCTDFKIL